MIFCSMLSSASAEPDDERPEASARNWSMSFIDSVLPAPDSPLMQMAWLRLSCMSWLYAPAAIAKQCGGQFLALPWEYE